MGEYPVQGQYRNQYPYLVAYQEDLQGTHPKNSLTTETDSIEGTWVVSSLRCAKKAKYPLLIIFLARRKETMRTGLEV